MVGVIVLINVRKFLDVFFKTDIFNLKKKLRGIYKPHFSPPRTTRAPPAPPLPPKNYRMEPGEGCKGKISH